MNDHSSAPAPVVAPDVACASASVPVSVSVAAAVPELCVLLSVVAVPVSSTGT
jgi:hypothetical protein